MSSLLREDLIMARICELTGKRPMKGSIIWRSGKSKKSGGIGTHVTAITKRRFMPNLQRVKAVVMAKSGIFASRPTPLKRAWSEAPKRTWKKEQVKKAAVAVSPFRPHGPALRAFLLVVILQVPGVCPGRFPLRIQTIGVV